MEKIHYEMFAQKFICFQRENFSLQFSHLEKIFMFQKHIIEKSLVLNSSA